MMRDAMKEGDLVLFYHSNTKPPHVAGWQGLPRKVIRISHRGMLNASILMKNHARNPGGSWLTLNPFLN